VSDEDVFMTAADVRPLPQRRGPRVIEAYFRSECSECGAEVEVGDPIVSDGDGGWMEAHHA
jgi:hypothetical protein